MPLYAWIALGVFLLGLLAGSLWVGLKARRAWRDGWSRVKGMSRAADELSASTAQLEERIASLERRTAELQRDVERLSVSMARARILLGAVQEAKVIFDRVRAFVP